MKLSSPHTHSVFCDGKNTLEEMAEAAAQLGFVSLGFSGHAPLIETIGDSCGIRDERMYREEARRVAAQQKQMRVHLGIELDLYGVCEREKYEYILGSVHNLMKDGLCYAVDGKREEIETCIQQMFGGDPIEAARAYYRAEMEMCEKLKPEIAAHFDLFTKNNEDGTLVDVEDKRYQAAAFEALDAVKECGALLEVNTGAMARGYRSAPYPAPFILKRWKEMGGRVIYGSDCHNKDYLTYGLFEAVELMRWAGFTSVVRLGGPGETQFVEEELQQ